MALEKQADLQSGDMAAHPRLPAEKPVECMRRPIENNSSPGQAVYEPFSGSGTTIIAAEMTGFWLSTADIACVLAIDEQELQATYAHELDSGGIKANARVAESLYRKATGEGREAVTAAIFWLKTRARWKEVSVHEHTGRPDTPFVLEVTYEDSKLL
jgi:hypothetical protein